MNVWIIAVVYQGVFTGIELVTTNKAEAEKREEELIRQAVDMPTAPWNSVQQEYEQALGCCAKVDEIYLAEAVVEDASVRHCPYCNTGKMQSIETHYDQNSYSETVWKCDDGCGACQVIKNIPPEED